MRLRYTPMDKPMKGKLLCTDLDGTLFYPKNRKKMLTDENSAFLKKFIDDGGEVLLVSSRNLGIKKRIEEVIERPLNMVGCNGGFVHADGKFIYEKFFNNRLLKECLDYMDHTLNKKICMISTKMDAFIAKKNLTSFFLKSYFSLQGVLKENYVRDNELFKESIEKGKVYKVMQLMGFFGKGEEMAYDSVPLLSEKFPEIEFVASDRMLEMTPKGVTKSHGISFYLEHRGISHDNVWVVGDSGNDVPMFDTFLAHSFCMSHAPEEVKARAKHTVSSVSEIGKWLYPSEDSDPSQE